MLVDCCQPERCVVALGVVGGNELIRGYSVIADLQKVIIPKVKDHSGHQLVGWPWTGYYTHLYSDVGTGHCGALWIFFSFQDLLISTSLLAGERFDIRLLLLS